MNKTELIAEVQKTLGKDTSQAAAQRAVDAVIEAIKSGIQKSAKKCKPNNRSTNAVQLIGFGTFKVVWNKAREGRNPSTGEKLKIKASKAVKFLVSSTLKKSVK